MGGGRKILPTPSLVKIHNRIKRYIWKDKQANIIFGLIVCYIDIGGGERGEGVGFAPSSIHPLRPLGPSYRFIIAGTIFSIAWTFHLSKRLCRPPSSPSPWRREKLAGATLWWIRGMQGKGRRGKSVRVKTIFRRSLSFHPGKEYHLPFPLLAIYLTTSKFLRNRLPFFSLRDTNTELPSFPAIHL